MAQLLKKSIKLQNSIFYFWDYMILLCFFVAVIGLGAMLFLDKNHRAIYYMKIKNYGKSQELLLKALDNQPFSSLYRMNLALNYLLMGQYENSIQEYQSVADLDLMDKQSCDKGAAESQRLRVAGDTFGKLDLQSRDKKVAESRRPRVARDACKHDLQSRDKGAAESRRSHAPLGGDFNSAVAASGKGEVDRALSFYQKALSYRPRSIEAKTNIELLTRKTQSKKNQKQDQKQDQDSNQKQNQNQKRSASDSDHLKNKNSQMDRRDLPGSDRSKTEKKPTGPDSNQRLLNKAQVEAVLKSIQEQEKNIKQRRETEQQGYKNRGGVKDW